VPHLIAVDVEYRHQQGEHPQAAEYRARFPPSTPPGTAAHHPARGADRAAGRYNQGETLVGPMFARRGGRQQPCRRCPPSKRRPRGRRRASR
jgi:hypothetical protein